MVDVGPELIVIEEAAGKDVSTLLGEIERETVIPAVGALLALLHRTPASAYPRVRKRVSRASELADTRAVLADVAREVPGLQARAERVLASLGSAIPLAPRVRTVLLHGSFRLNHVFLDESGLTPLDLDGLRKGEPDCDLATFLSSLYQAEAEGRLDPAAGRQLACLVLRGYAASVPWTLDPAVLLWFLANLLINKQAHKYLRHGDQRNLRRILALAEEALATAAALPAGVRTEDLGELVG